MLYIEIQHISKTNLALLAFVSKSGTPNGATYSSSSAIYVPRPIWHLVWKAILAAYVEGTRDWKKRGMPQTEFSDAPT
jgi:hypothetical protein